MPERTKASAAYRYGFNGKENDQDMSSDGLPQDFGSRIYEPRLGRWLSLDPLQRKFPDLSPYNFCYNTPIQVYDPDGRLGVYVEVKYNAETGKYTILKMTFTDDLEAKQGNWKTDWHDFIVVYNNVHGVENLNYNVMSATEFRLLSKRESTFLNIEGLAKAFVDDGIFEDHGGIMFTSFGANGSEETRVAKYADGSNNIDGLLALVAAQNSLAGHEFDKKGLLEILDKMAEIGKESLNKKPGDDGDKDDPVQKLLKELDDLIKKYEPESESKPKAIPKTGIEPGKSEINPMFKKPGSVIYHRAGGYKTKNTKDKDGTMGGTLTNEPATDTFPAKRGYGFYHPINE